MRRESRTDAFTLVEMVVVVLILGILAGVAAPQLLDVQQHAAEQATITQVHEIFRAAELYKAEHGVWPANTGVKEFPPEFAGMLPESVFLNPSPIGRQFDWNGAGTGMPSYGVSIPPPLRPRVKQSTDDRYDDGNLETGWITESNSGALNFELAPK